MSQDDRQRHWFSSSTRGATLSSELIMNERATNSKVIPSLLQWNLKNKNKRRNVAFEQASSVIMQRIFLIATFKDSNGLDLSWLVRIGRREFSCGLKLLGSLNLSPRRSREWFKCCVSKSRDICVCCSLIGLPLKKLLWAALPIHHQSLELSR